MEVLLPTMLNREERIYRKDNPFGDRDDIGCFKFYHCVICALIITGNALVVGLSLVGKYEDGWDVSAEVLAIPFLCILLPCAIVFICWFGFFIFECFSYCRCQALVPTVTVATVTVPTMPCTACTDSAHCPSVLRLTVPICLQD